MKLLLNKFNVVLLIFTVLFCSIFWCEFSNSSIYALAQETKEFSDISIDDNFDNSSVLVVLNEGVGGINKIHNKSYFGDFGIESIVDITYMETSNPKGNCAAVGISSGTITAKNMEENYET